MKWVVKTNKWTKKDWKLWVFLLLKKEKLFAKFSTRHDKKMVTNTCLGTFSPKFFWYYLSKAFQNHKCHIQLKAKKNPLLLPLWKTRFFMVDEIQIEIGVVSLSDERSILTEMGDDILSFGNSKAMAKQAKKRKSIEAWNWTNNRCLARVSSQVVSNNGSTSQAGVLLQNATKGLSGQKVLEWRGLWSVFR